MLDDNPFGEVYCTDCGEEYTEFIAEATQEKFDETLHRLGWRDEPGGFLCSSCAATEDDSELGPEELARRLALIGAKE